MVDGALSFAGASREVWLESACQGDTDLLRAVKHAIGREQTTGAEPRLDPEQIGGFQIVRRLGEGGMEWSTTPARLTRSAATSP